MITQEARVQKRYSKDVNATQALVVEDDPFSQKLFSHIINKVYPNCRISFASDFAHARKKLLAMSSPDFAVIDVFIEGSRSGIDFLNFLDQGGFSVPVIMTSSLPPDTFYEMARVKNHNFVYLKKPFQPDVCYHLIEQIKYQEDKNA